jgi:hypothetical protein
MSPGGPFSKRKDVDRAMSDQMEAGPSLFFSTVLAQASCTRGAKSRADSVSLEPDHNVPRKNIVMKYCTVKGILQEQCA